MSEPPAFVTRIFNILRRSGKLKIPPRRVEAPGSMPVTDILPFWPGDPERNVRRAVIGLYTYDQAGECLQWIDNIKKATSLIPLPREQDVNLYELEQTGWIKIIRVPIAPGSNGHDLAVEELKGGLAGNFDTRNNFNFFPTNDAGREIVAQVRRAIAEQRKAKL